MSIYLSGDLRKQLSEVDDQRCAYCRTSEACSGFPMVVDHVIPQSKGGRTEFENLCMSCHRCNEFKCDAISGEDPITGETVALFHPRQQPWAEHFRWDAEGVRIIGTTAVGRASVIALQMNNEVIVPARRRWLSVGWHPPRESQ
jgi:hypothetical protein